MDSTSDLDLINMHLWLNQLKHNFGLLALIKFKIHSTTQSVSQDLHVVCGDTWMVCKACVGTHGWFARPVWGHMDTIGYYKFQPKEPQQCRLLGLIPQDPSSAGQGLGADPLCLALRVCIALPQSALRVCTVGPQSALRLH